jgi:hypothetical protein
MAESAFVCLLGQEAPMSNSENTLYRKRSEIPPRIVRQRRIIRIVGAIAILIVFAYLAH